MDHNQLINSGKSLWSRKLCRCFFRYRPVSLSPSLYLLPRSCGGHTTCSSMLHQLLLSFLLWCRMTALWDQGFHQRILASLEWFVYRAKAWSVDGRTDKLQGCSNGGWWQTASSLWSISLHVCQTMDPEEYLSELQGILRFCCVTTEDFWVSAANHPLCHAFAFLFYEHFVKPMCDHAITFLRSACDLPVFLG